MSKAFNSYVADLNKNGGLIQNRLLNILAFVVSTVTADDLTLASVAGSVSVPRYDKDRYDSSVNGASYLCGLDSQGRYEIGAATLLFALPATSAAQGGSLSVDTRHPSSLNPGAVAFATLSAAQVADPSNVILFEAPAISGYVFKGWYTPHGGSESDTSWSQSVALVAESQAWSSLRRDTYVGCVSTSQAFTLADALATDAGTPICGFRWRNFFQATRPAGSRADASAVTEADSYRFNLLQAVYAKAITVTFDAQGGTASESVRYLEANDSGKARLGTLPTATRSGCTFKYWWIPLQPRNISESTFVDSDVTLRAGWAFDVGISVPVGASHLGHRFSDLAATGLVFSSAYDPVAVSPGDTLSLASSNDWPLRFVFAAWGGYYRWTLTHNYTEHAAYDAYIAEGNSAFVRIYDPDGNDITENSSIDVADFGGRTCVVNDLPQSTIVCTAGVFVPVKTAAGVASVVYSIDGGQSVTVAPDDYGVAWIEDVPPGSTVSCWGVPSDQGVTLNATEQAPLVKTFDATRETTEGVFFHVRPDSVECFEVRFDNYFSFLGFLASASSIVSDGDIFRRTASLGSDFGRAFYEFGFVLFGTHATQPARTSDATGAYSIQLLTDEQFTFAVDVHCAPIVNGAIDPVFDDSADTTTAHCSVRLFFTDSNGDLCLDTLGDPVSVVLADGATSIDFVQPDDATAMFPVFEVEPGYRADFFNVRIVPTDYYSTVAIPGADASLNADSASFIVVPLVDGARYAVNHVIPTPTRPGYDFAGWQSWPYSDCGNFNDSTRIVRRNLALRSSWSGHSIVVMLNPMGGGFVNIVDGYAIPDTTAFRQRRTVGLKYGGEALDTPLPTPIRNGYIFDGWFTAPTGGSLVTDSTRISEPDDHTLYAHWSISATASRTLAFYPQGGSCQETSRSVVVGQPYGSLPVPVREDYAFAGWFTHPTGGSRVSADTLMGETDADIFAHWSIHTVTVTFDPGDGSCDEPSRIVALHDIIGALPIPSRDGFNFLGWFSASSGGSLYDGTESPSTSITLYAQWESAVIPIGYIKYKIKLDLDGGALDPSYGDLKYIKGYPKPLPSAAQVSKPGAIFAGWYTSADFSGDPATSIPASATGSQSFYAKWL